MNTTVTWLCRNRCKCALFRHAQCNIKGKIATEMDIHFWTHSVNAYQSENDWAWKRWQGSPEGEDTIVSSRTSVPSWTHPPTFAKRKLRCPHWCRSIGLPGGGHGIFGRWGARIGGKRGKGQQEIEDHPPTLAVGYPQRRGAEPIAVRHHDCTRRRSPQHPNSASAQEVARKFTQPEVQLSGFVTRKTTALFRANQSTCKTQISFNVYWCITEIFHCNLGIGRTKTPGRRFVYPCVWRSPFLCSCPGVTINNADWSIMLRWPSGERVKSYRACTEMESTIYRRLTR